MPPSRDADLPAGLTSLVDLPDDELREHWSHIFVANGTKERLRDYALFALATRQRYSYSVLPTHGLVVLAGPPGTGKTSLALGLADAAARELASHRPNTEVRLAVLDVHGLPSELLGGTQRAVARLFEHEIPDLAEGKDLVVLLDEVEALAVNRRRASFETNPVDVHRATDALLTGLDSLARTAKGVLLVATTNDIAAVDPAFLSRADLVEEIGLPSQDVLERVLVDSVERVAGDVDRDVLRQLAHRGHDVGMDARQARKLVLRAITSHGPQLALDPERLTATQLAATFDDMLSA